VPPEEEGRLASALRAADVDHTIENYRRAPRLRRVRHAVYHRPAAERLNRLLRLFQETLH
jgi:carboxymethylenebutenolidase